MITESEILDRHKQSLGEAHRACQEIGRNAADDYAAPRGPHYTRLRDALDKLEGSSRQMAHFREDARWLKLGIVYAKAMRLAQAKYIGQRWGAFNEMMKLFELGHRRLEELEVKTGSRGAILPARASEWLVLPDHKIPWNRGTQH